MEKTILAHRLLFVLASGAALCASSTAQTVLYTLSSPAVVPGGNHDNERLGQWVQSAGDVNLDGKPDIIVGAPENGNIFSGFGEGFACVYSGATGTSLFLINGAAVGDAFGSAVCGAGDVNHDLRPDIVVGAPLAGTGGSQIGKVYVYSGTGSTTPLWTFSGTTGNDQLGSAVAGAGDVNNDTYADIIAGAPLANTAMGLARVYSGKTGVVLWTVTGTVANGHLGQSVDGVGDINGDGYGDFIVGSILAGAKIYSGQNGSPIAGYSYSAVADHRLGTSVAGVGLVDGDSVPDFMIGATQTGPPLSPGNGYAKVYSGATGALIWTFNGDAIGDRFGVSVAHCRDLNGDGRSELIVGADQKGSSGNGYLRVFDGASGAIIHSLAGTNSTDGFGTCVDGLGDVNADGKADFIAGLPGVSPPGHSQYGSAIVYSTTPTAAFNPFCAGDGLDQNVSTACPCGNVGAAGRGCANSVNPAGGLLSATGTPNPDSVVLQGSGMPGTVSCIYLQGDARSSMVFGDGVLCLTGNLIRLKTKSNVGGASQFPDVGDPLLSVRGAVTPGSGALRYYQAYYRNSAAAFCPPETFNVTNGWKITW